MSIFNFSLEEAVAEEKVFKGFIEKSGVYAGEIVSAELKKSQSSESEYLALAIDTEEGLTIKHNIVLTNKAGEPHYIDKKSGDKRLLPGHQELSKLIYVCGLAKKFKGDFGLLVGCKVKFAVEIKEKLGSKYPDKNFKNFYEYKSEKTAYEIKEKKDANNIEFFRDKFANAEAVKVSDLNERAVEIEAKQDDDDSDEPFPF